MVGPGLAGGGPIPGLPGAAAAAVQAEIYTPNVRISLQGKDCAEGYYSRTMGLTPDVGEVKVRLEEAKALLLEINRAQMPGTGDFLAQQPMSIQDVDSLPDFVDTGGGRVPQESGPVGPGFQQWGQLVFEMRKPLNNTGKESKTVIDYVYVHTDGLRDAIEDQMVKDGTKGLISVSLSDIRIFYGRYGALVQDINHKLPSGNWDQRTVHHKGPRKHKPFNLGELFRWMVHHLPGNPTLLWMPVELREKEAPGLSYNWDDPAASLQSMMDKYSLEYGLTLAGEAVLSYKGHPHRKFEFFSSGRVITPPEDMLRAGPMKSVHWSDVPAVVTVVGAPYHQNRTERLVPVSLDLDGKIKPIWDVWKNWGLPQEDVFADVTNTEERRWTALLGRFSTKQFNPQVYRQQLRIARECWFKWFLIGSELSRDPAHYSSIHLPIRGRAVIDDDEGPHTDMHKIAQQLLGLEKPESEVSRNGDHKVRLEKPRVVAEHLIQQDVHDRDTLLRVLEEELSATRKELAKLNRDMNSLIADMASFAREEKRKLIESAPGAIVQRGRKLKDLEGSGALIASPVLAIPAGILEVQGKEPTLPKGWFFGTEVERSEGTKDAEVLKFILQDSERLDQALEELEKRYQKHRRLLGEKIGKLIDEIEKIKKNQDATERPRLQLWTALRGPVPEGNFEIEEGIGLVKFRNLVAMFDKPFSSHFGDMKAVDFELPEITYGVQHDWNNVHDWWFCNVTIGEGGKADIANMAETVPFAPHVKHEPSLVCYVDRENRPFNVIKLQERAIEIAEPLLTAPPIHRGFRYQYNGFWPIDAIFSVNQISWSYQAGEQAKTEIVANDRQWAGRGKSAAQKNREAWIRFSEAQARRGTGVGKRTRPGMNDGYGRGASEE